MIMYSEKTFQLENHILTFKKFPSIFSVLVKTSPVKKRAGIRPSQFVIISATYLNIMLNSRKASSDTPLRFL